VLQSDFESVYGADSFELIHIDTDNASTSALHSHWDQYNPTFPVLAGCASSFSGYSMGYIPHNVIIDPFGVVRYTYYGFYPSTLHSIIGQYMSLPTPSLSISENVVCADDNMDGRPDAGETAEFCLTLLNNPVAQNATAVTATLSCSDPNITILQNEAAYGAIASGASASGLPFQIEVAVGVEPMLVSFSLHVTSTYTGGVHEQDLVWLQRIARPEILIVDGDGSADDNETFLTAGLSTLGRDYDIWDRQEMGPLDAIEATRYSQLFWLGGMANNDMDAQSLAALQAFIDQGGLTVFSHQYFSQQAGYADFLSQNFGAEVLNPYMGNVFLATGVEGHPHFDQIDLVLTGSTGANNNANPDQLGVLPGGQEILTWAQLGLGTAAVAVEDGLSLRIFCGFPLEAMRLYSSLPNTVDMSGFLQRVYGWYDNLTVIPPAAVSDLVASFDGSNYNLSWSAVEGASAYNLYFSTDPFLFPETPSATVTETGWSMPTTPGAVFVQVKAVN
jgi:hypothetical protein